MVSAATQAARVVQIKGIETWFSIYHLSHMDMVQHNIRIWDNIQKIIGLFFIYLFYKIEYERNKVMGNGVCNFEENCLMFIDKSREKMDLLKGFQVRRIFYGAFGDAFLEVLGDENCWDWK